MALERQRVNDRHVQPHDLFTVVQLEGVVVVVRELMMRLEVTMDGRLRVWNAGFMRVLGCHA
jgi:hypothetical protein